MKNDKIYKPCNKCRGTGKLKIREPLLSTPDTRRMLAIMKKNGWKQLEVAKVIGVSSACVNGWFHRKTNLEGKIKKIYFDILEQKGFTK